jgi:hypothetical protein
VTRLSDRERLDRRTTGADLQRQVTDLAAILGWTWVHFRPAMTGRGWRTPVEGPLGKGWPDLVLVRERDRRLIFAELKREISDPVTYDQDVVLETLRSVEFDRRRAVEGFAGSPGGVANAAAHALDDGWPSIQVFVWRPSDLEQIAEVLK